MQWLKNFFAKILQNPKRASAAQRAVVLSEVMGKLDTGEFVTDGKMEVIGKNFETVKAFMKTLEDPTEIEAYEYWVSYFEDKYKRKKINRDAYRKIEEETKVLIDTMSKPKW